MNPIKLLSALAVILLLTPACKKELTNGGISFSFSSNKPYSFSQLYVAISASANSEPLMSNETFKVEEGVKITGIKPGKYFWYCLVAFSSSDIAGGSHAFNGEIIIEKGKMYEIEVSL